MPKKRKVKRIKCDCLEIRLRWVEFKDGSLHIEKKCSKCGRCKGYLPRSLEAKLNLPLQIEKPDKYYVLQGLEVPHERSPR